VQRAGRLVAVWGPTGGPGRTTLAVGIAAEAAHRGLSVSLIDADPYGGAAGQHLAVLEEVSGLLAATRLANVGTLDPAALARVARQVVPGVRLVTGLPRPDRWNEVRSQAFREVLSVARRLDELVVVDTGFGLPAPMVDVFGAAPDRDDMTLAAIEEADEVVVVASADPVGLTRLARSLRDLLDLRAGGPSHVVVNRMRSTLGWTERDIRYLVGGVAPGATVTFLPDDRAAADRSLVSGRPLVECGDSALRRAVAGVVDVLLGPTPPSGSSRSPATAGKHR
jgi:MinD-like ATPase involved in chromosome partitioning or flagellar assembly